MARTSQTPRGRASQSDFDALLRQEIARSSGRGGETDVQGARDRLARRMNIQEGRTGGGATSTAYRPAAPAQRASSGSKSKSKGGGGKPSRGKPAPGGGLPDTGPVLPDRPDTADPGGGGWPTWLLPLILAANRKGTRMMGGEGGPPDQSGGALEPRRVATQPVAPGTGNNVVDAEYEVMRRPLPIAGPGDVRPIPYSPDMGRLPPPATATDDAIGRFLSDSEIQDMAMRARMYPEMESGMSGAGGGRLGGQVYRPGIDMPAPAPGLHGSKFAQPILKHIVP